jgi:DNA-binding PadR family transcriptional regulator
VRSAVLLLLAERPMHGYEIIQQITERSRGWWKPSPGSVYPTLQLLADEGLVTTEQDNPSGKRLYALTDEGRTAAGQQDRTPPWEQAADDVDPNDVALREALHTLMAATMQLSAAGTTELRAKAARLLVETRRQLYLLLADADMRPEAQTVQDAVGDAAPESDDE